MLDNIDSPNFTFCEKTDTSLENIGMKVSNVCREVKRKFGMTPHPVQVMTVLRLADDILNDRGSIAEVKTGEGKSFIIAILGTVLAQFGRTVDVVTSTSELAKRDQENQKKYYDLFGISSDVLTGSVKNKDSLRSESSDSDEFNLDALDKQIVYSTNSTFEFVFLHGIFMQTPLRKRPYDVVIVDEIDNMLLDQGESPAIIANSMQIKNRVREARVSLEELHTRDAGNQTRTADERLVGVDSAHNAELVFQQVQSNHRTDGDARERS